MLTKKLISIALVLLPLYGISQSRKPIDGFLGIKFGSDIETVKKVMATKGARLVADSSSRDVLLFDDVTFENRKNVQVFVKLVDGKAYEADLGFPTEPLNKSVEFYNNVVKEFNETYGIGLVTRNFKSPYIDGDGKELEAIKTGNAQIFTIWADEANDNAIEVMLDSTLYTIIIVQNGTLQQAAANKPQKE